MKYDSEYWNDVEKVVAIIPNIINLYNKRILITGVTGMICSAIVDVLIYLNRYKNANITLNLAGRDKKKIAERFDNVLTEGDWNYIEFDSTKTEDIDITVDYIINGASYADPAMFSKQPVEILLSNVLGLNCLLKLAKNNVGCRLLHLSSSEVYGNRINGVYEPYKEEDYGFVDIMNPRSCYPSGKRAADTLCVSYSAEYDVDSVMVRPGHIYGPSATASDSKASSVFMRDVLAKRNIVMKSAGSQMRSYCYSLDCASAILTVLINGERTKVYNISDDSLIKSIRDIAEELAKQGGVDIVFENPSDKEQKSFNMMSNSALNGEKLVALGWKPVFNLHDGVERTLRYY